MLSKLIAFIQRDFRVMTSYKLNFVLQFFGIFFSVLMFYFISKIIPGQFVAEYGGDYFSFVLIGIAFGSFLGLGMSNFSGTIRGMQVSGTLESVLSTPTNLSTILIGSSLWSYLFTSFNVLIYFLFGFFIFGMIINANVLPAAIILVLTIVSFSSIGIISAGFILVFKQGNPFIAFTSSLFNLLGGMLYPITVMPGWLQAIAAFLPITYPLRGMRLALLQGYSLQALSFEILALLAFSIILFPISILFFRICLNKAKKEGSLVKY